MKLKSKLSPVRAVLECTTEELKGCKAGEYVEFENGSTWLVDSVDETASTIVARECVTEHFIAPNKLGRN